MNLQQMRYFVMVARLGNVTEAVSYTHLDVYKRQEYGWRLSIPLTADAGQLFQRPLFAFLLPSAPPALHAHALRGVSLPSGLSLIHILA